jgi:tetratricopeptide (TPR) repeat protein
MVQQGNFVSLLFSIKIFTFKNQTSELFMRSTLLFIMLMCSIVTGFAQGLNNDTLRFDKRASRSENQWVAVPNGNRYTWGFIYVDTMAGFTLNVSGIFTIAANGAYLIDTATQNKLKYAGYKVRLGPNTKLVSYIPKMHQPELGINGNPDWLKIYNNYTDTLAHNVIIGKHLNSMMDCAYALTYLLKTYKVKPHAPGLEFELAYAYNVLRRMDDAISVLEPALKNTPGDILMYKELGYAYLEKKDIDKAIEIYKRGIDACGDTHLVEKAEMAINIGSGYRYLKNDELYKEWEVKAKGWAPVNSAEYKKLVQMGF